MRAWFKEALLFVVGLVILLGIPVGLVVILMMTNSDASDSGGRIVPDSAASCGPRPTLPADDPTALEVYGKWNRCAFPNLPTGPHVDPRQQAWDDYADEVRSEIEDECRSEPGACSKEEILRRVDARMESDAEMEHDIQQQLDYLGDR